MEKKMKGLIFYSVVVSSIVFFGGSYLFTMFI